MTLALLELAYILKDAIEGSECLGQTEAEPQRFSAASLGKHIVGRLMRSVRRLAGNPQDNFSARVPLESLLKCLARLRDRQHAVHEGA